MMQTAEKQPVSTNFELSQTDFQKLSKIVESTSGILLPESKKGLVKSRLQKRLRELKLNNYGEYINLVSSSSGAEEMSELISAISTNVTSFNREAHHFKHFEANVVPQIVSNIQAGQSARVWSAGCSNGSEPFTIACSVMNKFPGVSKDRFQILATDIDKYSLETARSGLYNHDMVSKMPPEALERYFSKEGESYRVNPDLQRLVAFKYLNLMTPWPIKKKYDAIFCRNVMIYFSEDVQADLLWRFSQHLNPGAFIYIGHSERIVGPAANHFTPVGATTYRYEAGGIG